MNRSALFRVYNKARAAARRGELDEKRVNEALGILQRRNYERPYRTTIWYCDCPDSVYRGIVCKHRIALQIRHRMTQQMEDPNGRN